MTWAWLLVRSRSRRQTGIIVASVLYLAAQGVVQGWQLSCACMGLSTAVPVCHGAFCLCDLCCQLAAALISPTSTSDISSSHVSLCFKSFGSKADVASTKSYNAC